MRSCPLTLRRRNDRNRRGAAWRRPDAAQLYDYYLGGTHNLPVDRAIAAHLKATVPELLDGVRANRAFHQRSAVWMAAQAGIRQFIDLGSGLPTQSNTHEAVQAVAPGARVGWPGRVADRVG